MRLKSIEEEWQGYSAMIFKGVKPGEVQLKETKQAFFSGAWAMLCAMKQVGEESVTENQGVAYFEACQKEGQAFYRKMMRDFVERN